MWRHFRLSHSDGRTQSTLSSDARIIEQKPISYQSVEELSAQLIRTVIDAELPFSFVENDEFKKLVSKLQPPFKLLPRKKVRSRIISQVIEEKHKIS